MDYQVIPVTSFLQNCSLVWCKQTLLGALIDPGGDSKKIKKEVKDKNLTIIKIMLTHGHIDHVGVAVELAQYYGVEIIGPGRDDKFLLQNLPFQSRIFGFKECQSLTPNHWLNEGNVIKIGNIALQVFHCPGHTPGHVVFFNEKKRLLISGDVIFKGSIGRSDFPGSNYNMLIKSIKEKLLPLGDDVVFIAGHGQKSTIKHERLYNYYLK